MILKEKFDLKLLVIFFYLTYTFTIKNYTLLNLGIVYLFCLAYILYNKEYVLKFINLLKNKIIKIPFFIMIFLCIVSILIPIIRQTGDFSYIETITSCFRTFFKYVPLIIYFDKNYKKQSLEIFMKYFCLSTCLYFLTTIFFILFPNTKLIWNQIIEDSSFHIILENTNYFSRYGICGFSGFQISFKFCIALCFSAYLLLRKERLSFENVGLYLFIFIGSFCYGRISILCSFVITFLTSVFLIKRNKKILNYIVFGLIGTIIVLIIAYNINGQLKIWLDWAFKPIINLIFEGKFYDRSLNIVLNKMIFFPGLNTLIFGDGLYTVVTEMGNSYYMHTDVGFMRNILYFGLPLTILYYMTILYPCYKILKQKENIIFKFFIILLVIVLFVFEIKGEICYRMLPIVIVILCLYLFNRKREDNNEN